MEEERKDSGVGVVEPKSLQLKLPEGGFKLRTGGVLADLAPTLLQLMGLPQPAEMTGKSLIAE